MSPSGTFKTWISNQYRGSHYLSAIRGFFVRYKINRDFESKDRFSPVAPVVEDEFFKDLCWGYRRKITRLNL